MLLCLYISMIYSSLGLLFLLPFFLLLTLTPHFPNDYLLSHYTYHEASSAVLGPAAPRHIISS